MATIKRIRCGAVLTMTGTEPAGPQIIQLAGDRIAEVYPAGDGAPEDGAETLDLSRYTVLPGLIDGHTHIGNDVMAGNERLQNMVPDAAIALRAAAHGAINLRRGVTLMRLCSEKNFIDVPLRAMFDSGKLPGPRLHTACRGLAPSHGHGSTVVYADGVDAVMRAVRENIIQGADHIKLFVTGGVATPGTDPVVACYGRREIEAAVEVAHRAGKTVCAHAYGGEGVDNCLAAGVDHIEHGIWMTERQYDRIAELDRWLVGTLGVFLTEPGPAENPSWPEEVRRKFLRAREATAASVAKAKRAGVKLALGTDAIHGAVCEEAIFAAAAGLTSAEALAAITCRAADLCGLAGRAGVIAPGAWADLIAVEGDPRDDLRVLRDVRAVLKGGERVV